MSTDDRSKDFPPTRQSGPRRRRAPLREELLGQSRKQDDTLTDPLHPVPEEMLHRFKKLGDTAPIKPSNKQLAAKPSHDNKASKPSRPSASELLARLDDAALGPESAISLAVGTVSELLDCKLACFLFPQAGSEQWIVLSSMGEDAGKLLLKQVTLPQNALAELAAHLSEPSCRQGISFDVLNASGASTLLDYHPHHALLVALPLSTEIHALMVAISKSQQVVYEREAKTIALDIRKRMAPHLAKMI